MVHGTAARVHQDQGEEGLAMRVSTGRSMLSVFRGPGGSPVAQGRAGRGLFAGCLRALRAFVPGAVLLVSSPAGGEEFRAAGRAIIHECVEGKVPGRLASGGLPFLAAASYKCTVNWKSYCAVELDNGEQRQVVRIGEGVGYSDGEETGCSEAESKAEEGAAKACTEHAEDSSFEPCSCVPIGPPPGFAETASAESANLRPGSSPGLPTYLGFDARLLYASAAFLPFAAAAPQEQNMCAPCDLLAEKYRIAYAKAEASKEALEEVVKAIGDFERNRDSASFAAGAVLFLKPIQAMLGVVSPAGRACSEVVRKWAGTLISGVAGVADFGQEQSTGRTALGAAVAYAGFGPLWDYFDAIEITARTGADTIELDQIERSLSRTRAKLTSHSRRFGEELAKLERDLRRGGCEVPSHASLSAFLGR